MPATRPTGPGTILEGVAKDVRFETTLGNVACQSAIEDEIAKPPTPKGVAAQSFIWELPFFGCEKLAGSSCTVSAVNLSFRGVFLWTSGSDGTMEMTEDSFNGPPGVHILCGTSISCTYDFESPLEVKGARFPGDDCRQPCSWRITPRRWNCARKTKPRVPSKNATPRQRR
jgi:hypothetical protein